MSFPLKLALALVLLAFAAAHVVGLREVQAGRPAQGSPAALMPSAD